jgi:hypothetical protein
MVSTAAPGIWKVGAVAGAELLIAALKAYSGLS